MVARRPIRGDARPAEQGRSDLALARAGSPAVPGLQGHRPSPRPRLGTKEAGRQSVEAMQGDELAERLKADVDIGEAGEIIGQPDRSFEQGAGPHLEADRMRPAADDDLFAPVAKASYDRTTGQTIKSKSVGVGVGHRRCPDGKNRGVEVGAPEDERGPRPEEIATPRPPVHPRPGSR